MLLELLPLRFDTAPAKPALAVVTLAVGAMLLMHLPQNVNLAGGVLAARAFTALLEPPLPDYMDTAPVKLARAVPLPSSPCR